MAGFLDGFPIDKYPETMLKDLFWRFQRLCADEFICAQKTKAFSGLSVRYAGQRIVRLPAISHAAAFWRDQGDGTNTVLMNIDAFVIGTGIVLH